MNISTNEIHENTNKQWNEMVKTDQTWKWKQNHWRKPKLRENLKWKIQKLKQELQRQALPTEYERHRNLFADNTI